MGPPSPPEPPKRSANPPGPPRPRAVCAEDDALNAEVRELLAAHRATDGGRDEPSVSSAAEADMARLKPEEAGDRIGPFKLLQQIGEGGFGVVWMAEQEQPVRRRVALKIIKLGMDTKEVIARFGQERQALAMMDHPNIAKVLDAGATPFGRPFFVMELVRGVKVTDYCDDQQLSTNERIELFITVCQAVQHAHQKGIIHRDLKPSNILVTINDGEAVPKVIDFGVAKATLGRLTDATLFTQFEQMIGTPLYMSPEQAEMTSLDIDTRSDIYSLGVLLYELLTGRTPIDTESLHRAGMDEIRRIIREVDPPRPSMRVKALGGDELTTTAKRRQTDATKLRGVLRGDLDWIVMKCLEKDRKRRYDTANGLAVDLRRHLQNGIVTARPPTAAYLISRLVRRNKPAFTAVAAVLVALVFGLVATQQQAVRARRAEREQNKLREVAVRALEGEKVQRTQALAEKERADGEARQATVSQQQSRRLLYAADMNLTQQSLKQNNLRKARQLLDRHRPQPGEEDLRGWEWRYLWQLARSNALVTLTNRPVRGYSVSFSPDGTRLAVGWFDGHVDLWDVPARRLIRALTSSDQTGQGLVAFSPNRNLLAATSESGGITLYDLDSDRESILWRRSDEDAWEVRDLAFSPDGSRVVISVNSSAEQAAAVWVGNVSTGQIESRHPAGRRRGWHVGRTRLSSDNRRLYLSLTENNYEYAIQCLDLTAGKEVWRTEQQADFGVSAMALSPDGQVLASGSAYEDLAIRIWDTTTGKLRMRLDGHNSWICELRFSKDGQRLISAASDQSIRIWDTNTWTEVKVLRGHTDEVHAVAISETAGLLASAGKDGNLMLWEENASQAADGYRRLPADIQRVFPLDQSRILMLGADKPPELLDLNENSPALPLPEIKNSNNVLGCLGTNLLCVWNEGREILVRELRDGRLIDSGSIALNSNTRPTGFAANVQRQLVAWTEESSPTSIYLTSLANPGRRIELKSDVPGLTPHRFSEDGNYLTTFTNGGTTFRAWNVETGRIVASMNGAFSEDAAFAAGGQVLVAVFDNALDHEVLFYDLTNPDRAPRRVAGKHFSGFLDVSPDGAMVASSTGGGLLRLFDPVKGELIDSIQGHLNAAFGIKFSADGKRLISQHGGHDAVKLWDVGTRQELLTLSGTGSILRAAHWSADGNVILAGTQWQTWRAPTWDEIAAAEAKEKMESKQR
jgi:serine/threonine protein kinase/WD40 repeat protein